MARGGVDFGRDEFAEHREAIVSLKVNLFREVVGYRCRGIGFESCEQRRDEEKQCS